MPEDVKKNQPTSRFYLRPLTNPTSSALYSHFPIGKNTIGKIMKSIASLGELEGRKTNHSARKTFATTLLDADIPITEIAQLGGWTSIQTLNEYDAPNIKKQKSVLDIVSKAFLIKVTEENNSENRHLSINTDTSNDEMKSVDENDKNESDVNSIQLVPVSNCHLQNSTACMPLTPRT